MVPNFQSFFKPLLEFAADGKAHTMKEAQEQLHKGMNISEEDLKALLPGGKKTQYANRISWAKTYFVMPIYWNLLKEVFFKLPEEG